MSDWRDGLTHKDWLFDGSPIRGEYAIDRFSHLDWSKAWVDLGPSIAGNLGPYWHVPMDDGDTVHRLYPKVLQGKWLMVIRQACIDYHAHQLARANPKWPDSCHEPASCARNGRCSYINCIHQYSDIAPAIEACTVSRPHLSTPEK